MNFYAFVEVVRARVFRINRGMWLVASILIAGVVPGQSAEPGVTVVSDLSYKTSTGLPAYEAERCRLDLYLPTNGRNFATLVWFHGGGLNAGAKDTEFTVRIATSLARAGVAVAAVNYRLSPKVTFPAYLDDAAASFAWIRRNIAARGGDPARVFVGGHSAGGYLVLMLGLDGRYLEPYGLKPGDMAGLIPISGQTMTHETIRQERGLPKLAVIADEAAPVYYAATAQDTPPWLILFADHDAVARAEENQYLISLLNAAGNKRVRHRMISDRTHVSIAGNIANEGDPARLAILEFITAPAAGHP